MIFEIGLILGFVLIGIIIFIGISMRKLNARQVAIVPKDIYTFDENEPAYKSGYPYSIVNNDGVVYYIEEKELLKIDTANVCSVMTMPVGLNKKANVITKVY